MQITARDRLGVVGAGVGRRTRAFDVAVLLETVVIVPRESTQHVNSPYEAMPLWILP